MRQWKYLPALLLAMLIAWCPGCATKSDALYKSMAVTEATVDKAMNGWGSYVAWKECQAGFDRAQWSSQQARVKQVYTTYRTTMNSAYNARATYVTSQGQGLTAFQSAVASAQSAAAELSKLIELWAVKPTATPTP